MNGVVDAVFGQPKQELIKLMQRSSCHGATDSATGADDSSAPEAVEAHIPHDFQETTSFRPCICAHCNGLVIRNVFSIKQSNQNFLILFSYGVLCAKATSVANAD